MFGARLAAETGLAGSCLYMRGFLRPRTPRLAGETGLKQPVLYRQVPKILFSPTRMASIVSYIGKAPKSHSRRREWSQIASPI